MRFALVPPAMNAERVQGAAGGSEVTPGEMQGNG
jgi:hypothetical protein